ncbi:MAG: alginate export family protein [Rhodospirillales bacterium]
MLIAAILPATAEPPNWFKNVKVRADVRSRYEDRQGVAFGLNPDVGVMLVRSRLGLTYTPASWFRVTGALQDSRAPLYGLNAPASMRDSADLYESYFELFPDRSGFGMTAGRAELRYGEGRLLATSSWGNVPRPFDHARVYYRLPKARLELLFVSPVKIRTGAFNRPGLGERVWGTYNVFPTLYRGMLLEAFALRREQNRPGGFTGGDQTLGTDRLTVNTFGFHTAGRLARGVDLAVDGALQAGRIAGSPQRAGAGVVGLSRRWMVAGRALTLLGEYKYASGSFDQLYPSTHDRFGHQDLFGWRNIHNLRSFNTLEILRDFAVSLMYNDSWLANPREALYNTSGQAIARSPDGAASRHIGRELDIFGTYKFKRFLFGAGYGYFFKGEFVRATTPGVNSSYAYCFQSVTY